MPGPAVAGQARLWAQGRNRLLKGLAQRGEVEGVRMVVVVGRRWVEVGGGRHLVAAEGGG